MNELEIKQTISCCIMVELRIITTVKENHITTNNFVKIEVVINMVVDYYSSVTMELDPPSCWLLFQWL